MKTLKFSKRNNTFSGYLKSSCLLLSSAFDIAGLYEQNQLVTMIKGFKADIKRNLKRLDHNGAKKVQILESKLAYIDFTSEAFKPFLPMNIAKVTDLEDELHYVVRVNKQGIVTTSKYETIRYHARTFTNGDMTWVDTHDAIGFTLSEYYNVPGAACDMYATYIIMALIAKQTGMKLNKQICMSNEG